MGSDLDISLLSADAEGRAPDVLRAALGPTLLAYIQEVLLGRFKIEPKGRRLLDLGCGDGRLAEEMSRLGFAVSALDSSAAAVAEAERRAEEAGLEINYHAVSGVEIPFDDETFDVTLLLNVLEHAPEVEPVLAEAARVTRRGGVLIFSSFNRTPQARLAVVDLPQRWRRTRVVSEPLHDWRLFVDPEALRGAMHRVGLERRELTGLASRAGVFRYLRALGLRRRGRISYAELGARLALRPSRDARLAYMGYAIKLSAS